MDLRLFAVVLLLVDLVLLALAVAANGGLTEEPIVLGLWAILVAGGSLCPLEVRPGLQLSMDMPLVLAGGMVLGVPAAGLLGLLACVDVREFRREVSVFRSAFNRSQVSISAMGGTLLFQLAAGTDGGRAGFAVAGALAVTGDWVLNSLMVAGWISRSEKIPFHRALGSLRIGRSADFFLTYSAFGLVSVLVTAAYWSAGFAGVLVAAVPVVLAYEAFQHRHRLQIADRLLAARKEALRNVDKRIAEERRDERMRIAEALHDEVLQSLFSVSIRAQLIREAYRSGRLLDLESDVPALVEATESAAEMLRVVIGGLRRSSVGHAGLLDTLTLLAGHLHDESGVRFVTDLGGDSSAPAHVEELVYLIVREAMTNAVRHAEARTVWVSLKRRAATACLQVIDDGRGFDTNGPRPARHYGLDLMEERAEAAGASLAIRSKPGSGTEIELLYPTTDT